MRTRFGDKTIGMTAVAVIIPSSSNRNKKELANSSITYTGDPFSHPQQTRASARSSAAQPQPYHETPATEQVLPESH